MSRNVEWGDEIVDYDWEVEDGTIEVSDKSGLGVEFDPEVARDHPGEQGQS